VADWLIDNASWPSNGSGIIRSPDGQIFAGGSYYNQIDLGNGPIVQIQDPSLGATSNQDLFLARLDPSTLKATWAVTFVGPQDQAVTSFAVDGAGHVGVIGPLVGSITVAGNEVYALKSGDQYILSASAVDGSGLWARRLNLQSGQADSRTVGLRAIAGDPKGSSFVVCGTVACATGPMRGDAGPDPNPAKDLSSSLVCQGGTDLVVARIDSSTPDAGTNSGNGAIMWADEVGGINDEYCGTLAMDAQSNAYVVGTYKFGSDLAFGSTTLPMVDSAGSTAWMYLAKLDPANTWTWAKAIGTGNQSITPTAILAIDVDSASSDVIVTGTINSGSQSFSMDGVDVVLDSPNFVARFEGSTGNLILVKGIAVIVNSMAADGGHVLATGSYRAAGSLGPVSLPPPDATGAFVAQIDGSSGAVVAAKGYGLSQYPNNAVGVVGIAGAAGTDQSGSLLLLSYQSKLDLGAPIGVVQPSSTSSSASCLARIAP
jgi:archaellum component FlaF (FlaF/FlaG flagellin family)